MLVSLNGIRFAASMTWFKAESMRDAKNQARFLKAKFGLFLPKMSLAAIGKKEDAGLMALSAIVASKINNGVAILALDDGANFLFVGAKDGSLLPSVKLGDRRLSGDVVLSKPDTKDLINSLGDLSVFSYKAEDVLGGLAITTLTNTVFEIKNRKAFVVKRLGFSKQVCLLLIAALLIILALSFALLRKPAPLKIDAQKFSREKHLLQLKREKVRILSYSKASVVMANLSDISHQVPVFTQGFRLTSLRYVSAKPSHLKLTYMLLPFSDISHVSALLNDLSSRGIDALGSTVGLNSTQIVIDAKVQVSDLNAKKLSDANLIDFVGALQRLEIPYQLSTKTIRSSGSTELVFNHLNAYAFKRLAFAVSHGHGGNFRINSVTLKVDKKAQLFWFVKGKYHA